MSREPVSSVFVALTNPLPGKEDEYNRWYTDIHLKEVVAVEGFISARRFKLAPEQPFSKLPYRYMAIYEVVPGQANAVLASLQNAISTMTVEPVIDMTDGVGVLAESISDTVRR